MRVATIEMMGLGFFTPEPDFAIGFALLKSLPLLQCQLFAPLGFVNSSANSVRPGGWGEAIPFGRPYRTHLNGLRKLLTARKRVRPIPARRLAWRHVSHHSSDRHSSPDSSSSSAPSDHSLSRHTPPDTTDADSSTPHRLDTSITF
ncbi:hypothetical protein Tco_0680639 [Tanacetum coccineum]|uniref:Uncharacterized protein n=1 Tax=Tanacetum coccineum TaxID=301880 RepID=A0ABQ4XL26_9ASTR